MKNRIYFFTGTGNSLKVAEAIASALPDSEVVAIRKGTETDVSQHFERIGFVFPVYFWGLPVMVADFLRNLRFARQNSTYFFAVATYGGIPGNAIRQANALLLEKGFHLNYGAGVKMFQNAVTYYDMRKDVDGITRESDQKMLSIAAEVENKAANRIARVNPLISVAHLYSMRRVHTTDLGFSVSADCISCGICRNVCPAKNITLEDGRPQFHHQCESCLACIQHCPRRAINYKDKTQSRGRYTHPQVGYKKIAQYYKLQ
jgi:ferredoxin/flavodoxin